MKSPIVYFGKKASVADVIWARLGDVRRYVEPFFGSGSVLLSRPALPTRVEIANDDSVYVANFFRAMQSDPDGVARAARWPKHECEIAARHRWLLARHDELKRDLMDNAEKYDAQAAGWWLWGNAAWLGSGWCTVGRNCNRTQVPHPTPQGYWAIDDFESYAREMQERLLRVMFMCGDWTRAVTTAMLGLHASNCVTGVLLDPPYDAGTGAFYTSDQRSVWHDAQRWAIEHGDDPGLRIVLCGYDGVGEAMPPEWETVHWDTGGAYGTAESTANKENGKREVLYFSPHCNRQMALL